MASSMLAIFPSARRSDRLPVALARRPSRPAPLAVSAAVPLQRAGDASTRILRRQQRLDADAAPGEPGLARRHRLAQVGTDAAGRMAAGEAEIEGRDVEPLVEQLRLQRQALHDLGLGHVQSLGGVAELGVPDACLRHAIGGAGRLRPWRNGSRRDQGGTSGRCGPGRHGRGPAGKPAQVGEVGGAAAQVGAQPMRLLVARPGHRAGQVGGADLGLRVGERDPTRLDAQLAGGAQRLRRAMAIADERRQDRQRLAGELHARLEARLAQEIGGAAVELQAQPFDLDMAAQRKPQAALQQADRPPGEGAAAIVDASIRAFEFDPAREHRVRAGAGGRCRLGEA
jgi:hypothetical protein